MSSPNNLKRGKGEEEEKEESQDRIIVSIKSYFAKKTGKK